jgi:DNA (cytosine-5)-methyltransferase 1
MSSYPTATDLFCGAGGSSHGAELAGIEVRHASNHWQRAVDTYAKNHPLTDVDCADISKTDPRRYDRTDILIASPECTNHSLAKGVRRVALSQDQMFGCDLCARHGESNCPKHSDPIVRSRAGGWDVVKFVEHHRYSIVILENVVDWLEWGDFQRWWRTMENLGYVGQKVFFNSMFAPPTPQSRDRLYIVWHRQGNRAPNVDMRPLAFCGVCDQDGNAKQVFKNGSSPKARYGKQYFYACATCQAVVHPYYFAAVNAIDWSIPAVPIGERAKHGLQPLKPRTMERIQYGIDRYGSKPLIVTVNQTNRLGGRVRPASGALFTQPGCSVTGMVSPFIVETAFSHAPLGQGGRARVGGSLPTQSARLTGGVVSPFALHMQGSLRAHGLDEQLSTQVASCPQDALLAPAFMLAAGSNPFSPRSVEEAMPTLTGSDRGAFAFAPSFIANLRGTGDDQVRYTSSGLDESLGTISAGGVHAAIVNLRDWTFARQLCTGVDSPLPTQVAGATTALLSHRSPFVVSYYGGLQAGGIDEAMDAIPTRDRHALVVPSIEEWCFRMFKPPEIGIGMAFPPTYIVTGNDRDQVKQYGNAVTPPVMRWLIAICLESLYPERPAYDPWAEWRAAA